MKEALNQPDIETRVLPAGDVTGRPEIVGTLAGLVSSHGTLYEWAADRPQPRALRGRAPVFVATLPESDLTVVVRHAWHGGLLAPLTGDLFRAPTRAPTEMQYSRMLRDIGIPTVEVLGFARYSAWLGLCRVDVVTRFIPDAHDLGMVAAGLAPHIDLDDALGATLKLLIRLAEHGVIHPDLNVKNILLRAAERGALEALIIDIDVVRWDSARPPSQTMRANTTRLARSMRKWRSQLARPWSTTR